MPVEDPEKPDFSNVRSGSSSSAPSPTRPVTVFIIQWLPIRLRPVSSNPLKPRLYWLFVKLVSRTVPGAGKFAA